jgi:hypothetical protein
MTVYGVYQGGKYEGGSVNAVFSTLEKAREYALALVERENFEANLNHQYSQVAGYGGDLNIMEEITSDTWDNGIDVISVTYLEVDVIAPPFQDLIDSKEQQLKYHLEAMEDFKNKED